jgi:hypothetical protein
LAISHRHKQNAKNNNKLEQPGTVGANRLIKLKGIDGWGWEWEVGCCVDYTIVQIWASPQWHNKKIYFKF